jgi:murein L,D-transpeptidase YcbB/YkuD
MDSSEAANIIKAGENARVPFATPIPVYIAYFTMASGDDGKLAAFGDIYGRDAAVVASFARPREEKITQPAQIIIANDRPGT